MNNISGPLAVDGAFVGASGIEGAGGVQFFVDPTHGLDTKDGTNVGQAKASLPSMSVLRDGYNDVVKFIGKASAYNPTAPIVWSNNYTHLIGINNGMAGMGQRSRIVNTAANSLATLATFSGRGNRIEGIQFFDGKNTAEDGQCVLVSGSNNHFVRCFFAGMGDATASGPATRAGSYSLKVSGSENLFDECTIGLDTIVRSAANAELIVSGSRNKFRNCVILCNSVTAGKFLVAIDNSGGDMRDTEFENCLFRCYTTNWATGITNVFSMPAGGATHSVLLDSLCRLSGIGLGWADNLTHIYGVGAAPNAGFGISLAPTT